MSNLSLQKLQQAFLAELSGNPDEAFRAEVKDNVLSQCKDLSGKMNKVRRLDIYCRNHVGARVSGLANVYPVCQQILGEELFYRLVSDYVRSFTSNHWDLNFHGEDFNEFLSKEINRLPTLTELFYLPDLARLEWAFHVCYFAGSNEPCALESQSPDKLRFVADASLQLMSSELPVFQIWHNNRQNRGELAVESNQATYFHLVHREEFIPQIHSLSEAQYLLISDCVNGKTLTEVVALRGDIVAQSIPLFIEKKWLLLSN